MTATTTARKPNKIRLRRIARMIRKHPQHFHMDSVVSTANDQDHAYFSSAKGLVRWFKSRKRKLENECGTTACIAGWAVYLYPDDVARGDDWVKAGARILGLDIDTARNLFTDFDLTPKKAANVLDGIADAKPSVLRKYADA